ncbi:SMP-30/gluconolactonase/LRE family protein [Iodidimonas sp. SYSU 1G8]|uniref:SMP-30/gluconolactonase/LRE family protein n=1 Tax=Iodidimonas sp. SYSU 1G8 TaxID=3133967 RepID=UPI0031FEC2A7
MNVTEIASGLRFPEGPIAMPDGSVILVEIERGTLSRVQPNGDIEVIAKVGGGPNGAAMGPDGWIYICNNGGFAWHNLPNGGLMPGNQSDDYTGGRIERVNPETGEHEVVFTECDGVPLKGPNDLVFDRSGGFYFTDLGKRRQWDMDLSSVYYARPDGKTITRLVHGVITANGCALSPDETVLYFAETTTGRLWAVDLDSPGKARKQPGGQPHRLVRGLDGHQLLDSMAVDAEGNVCVATLINGGITSFAPDGSGIEHFPFDDILVTNICFGGKDLRTAYITLSTTGKLIKCEWPRPGLALNFLNK